MQELDFSVLDGESHAGKSYPPMVPGRVLHVDADFVAYHISYEKEGDPKTIEDMQHNGRTIIDDLRQSAGAEHVHLHLTPDTSDKGGRYTFAIQQPYQGNREDKPKPRLLHHMREWLATAFPGTLHQRCEADDGMSSMQYAAIASGNAYLSCIASKDKDLRMVPGMHVNWETGEQVFVDPQQPFGWVHLVESKSALGVKTSKLHGYGQKWFWAQMLIGDSADYIKGLPLVMGSFMNSIKPTAPVIKAREILNDQKSTEKQRSKAVQALNERKAGKCGPATAILLLDLMQDNAGAFRLVRALYEAYGEQVGFTHYATGEAVPWQQVFLSEARMLWMRKERTNPDDVVDFLQEIMQ